MDITELDMTVHTDELKHFGVKGMRWGVRRSDEELARSANRKQQAFDAKISRQKAKLSVKEQRAKVKFEEGRAKQQLGDGAKKVNEAKKVKAETRAKIKADKKRAKEESKRYAEKQKSDAVRVKMEENKHTKKTSTKYNPKDYKHMTDDELRTVLNRVEMETKFKAAYKEPPSTLKRVMNTVGGVAVVADTIGKATGGTTKLYTAVRGDDPKRKQEAMYLDMAIKTAALLADKKKN